MWRVIQWFCQLLFVVWFRYRAHGYENLPAGGALLLINHQSFLDPLFVGAGLQRPVSYLARDNLFHVPVIGWILRKTYVMPISRESAGTESLRESIRRLKHGFFVGIFPEGTRTDNGSLGEFKPGFLVLLRRAGVPVIPVAVAGAFEAFPRGTLIPRPRRAQVVYGAPLNPERIAELSQKGREAELVAWCRDEIQKCLDQANTLRR